MELPVEEGAQGGAGEGGGGASSVREPHGSAFRAVSMRRSRMAPLFDGEVSTLIQEVSVT